MAVTSYLANEVLDHLWGKSTYTAVDTIYFGLCTGVTDAGVISGEPSSGNYSRKSMSNNKTTFGNAASGEVKNATAITFATPSADWGNITYVFVSDASSGNSNTLAYGPLAFPIYVANGQAFSLATNALVLKLV